MNCVKCGKSIPDGEIFCENCASAPLERAELRQEKASGRRVAKTAPTAQKQPRRRIGSVITIVLLSLVTMAALALVLYMYQSTTAQRANLRAQEADLAERERVLATQEAQVEALNAELETAEQSLSQLRERIAELEGEIKDSENSYSQNQYDLDTALKQLEELKTAKAEAETLITELSEAGALLQEQYENLAAEHEALLEQADVMEDKLDWIDAYVVYVENDDTNFYHTFECANFKRKSFWVYNRKLAENKGYTACPDCGG